MKKLAIIIVILSFISPSITKAEDIFPGDFLMSDEIEYLNLESYPEPNNNSLYIIDNVTGGDCYFIGIWDWPTKTCALIKDVYETIKIESDYIILDGNQYSIIGPDFPTPTPMDYGVYLDGRNGVTIKNLNIEKFTIGIYIYLSNNNTFINNTISNNYDGILSHHPSHNNTITHNIISDNDMHGIALYQGSNNNILTDNNTSNNMWGILISGSNNILADNILSNNRFSGIYLNHIFSTDNILLNNTISNNYYGIWVYESSDNAFTDNVVSNNISHGVSIFYSHNNIITNNTFSNNSSGFSSFKSNNNQIYNNNFIENRRKPQVLNYMSTGNLFNLEKPIGGNYWSDFDTSTEGCYDQNYDNFCDTPYYIQYSGADYLPWTKQDGWEMPVVTLTATPTTLWPPDKKMVDVVINGSVVGNISGIVSVVISIIDEYGIYDMTVPGFGSTIQLKRWRKGTDIDGRVYTIKAVATDNDGNQSIATAEVIVPHDMRK